MAFDRTLLPDFVIALNREYERQGWWHALANHEDTLIAIRDNYLNVYRNGCSIAKVRYQANGNLAVSVHYKFLLKRKLEHSYIPCEYGSPKVKDSNNIFIESLNEIEDVIYWSDLLGGVEKTGVHRVIRANPNVVDTEIALNVDKAEDEADVPASLDKGKGSRIDFCAVQESKGELALMFFEAKHYSYTTALRASEGSKPRVLAQLLEYENKLKAQRPQIEAAYRKSIHLAHALHGTNVLGKGIGTAGLEHLKVCTEPRLVVFGFDADQKKGSNFLKPQGKSLLRTELRDRLLVKGTPDGFTVGISTSGGEAIFTPATED